MSLADTCQPPVHGRHTFAAIGQLLLALCWPSPEQLAKRPEHNQHTSYR